MESPPAITGRYVSTGRRASVAIDVAPVRNARHDDEFLPIIDSVDDAVVTDADQEIVLAGQPYGAMRPWVRSQCVDGVPDPIAYESMKPEKCTSRLGMESNFIGRPLLRQLPRTSLHGTVPETSSVACSAARLSSRNSRRSMRSA